MFERFRLAGTVGRPHGVLFEARRREHHNAEIGEEYFEVQEHPELRRVPHKDLRGLRELPGTYRKEARRDNVIPAARPLGVLLLRRLPRRRFFRGPRHVREPGRGRSGGQGVRGETGGDHEEDLRDLQRVQAHDL